MNRGNLRHSSTEPHRKTSKPQIIQLMKKILLLIGVAGALCAGSVASAQTYELERIWEKHPADYPQFFVTNHLERGMAYNPMTGHLLIASRNNGAVHAIEAADGEYVGQLNMTGVSGGTFPINKVQVTEDGAIYVGNMITNTAGSVFNLYRWEDEAAAPVRVYSGDPSNGSEDDIRWGDSLAVRGTGADTMVLLGGFNGKMVALLRPNPENLMAGDSFSAHQISTDIEGNSGRNVAFGPGGLVYLSSDGNPLYELDMDFENGVVLEQREFGGAIVARGMGPLGYGGERDILVGLIPTSNQIYVYSRPALTTESTVNPLVFLKYSPTEPDGTYLPNGNKTGDVIVVGDVIYSFLTNNSIAALQIVETELTNDFAGWIATQDVPADQRGTEDDPDGDGVSNLLEYALGGDPAVASRDIVPVTGVEAAGEDQYLSIAYSKRDTAEGIDYVVEVSGDLVTWESGESVTTVVSDGVESAIVRDNTPMTDASRRFIRLRVVEQ